MQITFRETGSHTKDSVSTCSPSGRGLWSQDYTANLVFVKDGKV